MQFERTGDKEFPYAIVFEGDEAETARAMYVEEANLAIRNGNTDSLSKFVLSLDWHQQNEEDIRLRVQSTDRLAERFEDFHKRTDEMAVESAHNSALPPHLNYETLERLKLGELALELATRIREAAQSEPKLEPGLADRFDPDTELSRLMEESGHSEDA